MDSGRFILAVILMVAVMVVTNILFPAPRTKAPVAPADSAHVTTVAQRDSMAAAQMQTSAAAARTPATTHDSTQHSAASPAASTPSTGSIPSNILPADTVYVQSDLYRYGFSTIGGSLVAAHMLQHTSRAAATAGKPIDLASIGGQPLLSYQLTLGNDVVDVAHLQFRAVPEQGLHVALDGAQQLRLMHTDSARGFEMEIDYEFSPKSYMIDTHATVRTTSEKPAKLLIALGPNLAQTEKDSAEDARHRAYVLNGTSTGIRDVTFARFSKIGTQTIENGPFTWVALRNKYFVGALLEGTDAKMPFGGVIAKPVVGRYGAELTATLLPGNDGRFSFRTYIGPQDPKQLDAIGNGFSDVNPFGWRWARPILRPVGHGIFALLYGMHDFFGIGYGWALILFGVLIRVLLWPLNAKAMRSQMKNMELQPRIKEIQAKFKKEPEKLQKEMLKLYKEEGFNPMGGCLPSLIPFPILITLYFVFANAIAFRGVQFLWLPDLSQPDPLFILPVLLGASMFVLQWFSTRTAVGNQNQQMKVMMYTMPPIMTLVFLRFAAGLNLYYASMNLASIPQQMQILRERQRMKAARR